MTCVPSEESYQTGHMPRLISLLRACMISPGPGIYKSDQSLSHEPGLPFEYTRETGQSGYPNNMCIIKLEI